MTIFDTFVLAPYNLIGPVVSRRRVCHDERKWHTVKKLKIRIPEKFAIINLKVKKFGFMTE